MLDLDPGAAHPVRAVHRDPGLALRPPGGPVVPADQLEVRAAKIRAALKS